MFNVFRDVLLVVHNVLFLFHYVLQVFHNVLRVFHNVLRCRHQSALAPVLSPIVAGIGSNTAGISNNAAKVIPCQTLSRMETGVTLLLEDNFQRGCLNYWVTYFIYNSKTNQNLEKSVTFSVL